MPKLTLRIKDAAGNTLAESDGMDSAALVYNKAYAEGDVITLTSSEKNQHLLIQLDDAISPAFVYFTEGEYVLTVPFGEKKIAYSPKSFSGEMHLLTARTAYAFEISAYKNLAKNEYDHSANAVCFPHAHANVETRGESVFAARNAINGNCENRSHGFWPYESWGINQQNDAEITVSFGRPVEIDCMILFTRADFPHDNWWEQATFTFSDGSELVESLIKTAGAQKISFPKRTAEWVRMSHMVKGNDPSPFPALSQWKIYGVEAQ